MKRPEKVHLLCLKAKSKYGYNHSLFMEREEEEEETEETKSKRGKKERRMEGREREFGAMTERKRWAYSLRNWRNISQRCRRRSLFWKKFT